MRKKLDSDKTAIEFPVFTKIVDYSKILIQAGSLKITSITRSFHMWSDDKVGGK